MIPVKSIALQKTVKVNRVIGEYTQNKKGPTVIFIAGMHGNEPSGIFALHKVFKKLQAENPPFLGNLYALSGNLSALKKGRRYIDADLNRIWFYDNRFNVKNRINLNSTENQEKSHLLREFERIIKRHNAPIYVFDLHSTSSQSIPFLVLSDTLRNRRIVHEIPAPVILGLEEQTEGTLFSFLNRIGISAVLFEAGQHDSLSAIENHKAFIWMVLSKVGAFNANDISDFHIYFEILNKEMQSRRKYYEVIYRYVIDMENGFKMDDGFVSFQYINSGDKLAITKNGYIKAPHEGLIFMPLYQEQGEDGFFLIRKINRFWLGVSNELRKLKFDKYLSFLPGVSKHDSLPNTFVINKNVAFFSPLGIFHLFGYRKVITLNSDELIVQRRKYDKMAPSYNELLSNFDELIR